MRSFIKRGVMYSTGTIMDIESAVKFPMEDDDWIVTTLIGGLIYVASIFFFPVFLVNGYFVKVAREAMEGSAEPPAFENWGELFVDGIKAFVIVTVYQIIPLAVFAVVGGGSIVAMLSGSEAGAGVGLLGLLGAFAIYGVLALVFGYFGLAGLMNFVATGSVGAGFDVGTIIDVATDRDWLTAWAYVIGINIAFSVVFGVIGAIPIVNFLLLFAAPFASFYLGVVMYRIWGQGFVAATRTVTASETPTAEPA